VLLAAKGFVILPKLPELPMFLIFVLKYVVGSAGRRGKGEMLSLF
jgi:hypothetical protein